MYIIFDDMGQFLHICKEEKEIKVLINTDEMVELIEIGVPYTYNGINL